MFQLRSFSLTQGSAWGGGGAAPVPCVHLLVPQGEHLLHGGDAGAGEALAVLAHSDGLQPFGHRVEHGAIAAAGAGQADGDSRSKVQAGKWLCLFCWCSLSTGVSLVPWVKVGDGF